MPRKFWDTIINQNKSHLLCLAFTFFALPSWALFEDVFSAKNNLAVNESTSLSISSLFPKNCFDDTGLVSRKDCFPQNSLWLLKDGKRLNFSQLVKYWTDVFVYFVKVSPKGHIEDINGDGHPEFAFYPMVAGNNPVTSAYIYSIEAEKLVFYGTGQFHYERGPHVQNIIKGRWVEPAP